MEFPLFENQRKRLRWLVLAFGLLLVAYWVAYFYWEGFVSFFTLGGFLGGAAMMASAYKNAVLSEKELVLYRWLGPKHRIPYRQIKRLKRNPYSAKSELDIYYGKYQQLSLRSQQLDALEAALRSRVSSPAKEKTE